MEKKRCVITGIGIVSCFGTDKDLYYKKLLEGISGVQHFELEVLGLKDLFGAPVTGFSPETFLDKKEARRFDPVMAFSMGAAKLALEDAKMDLDSIDKSRAGAIISSGIGGMTTASKNLMTAYEKNYSRVSPFFIPHLITNMAGAVVGIQFGLTGPNYSISTACATANYSLLAAKGYIERGECDVMFAGGAEAAMNEVAFAGFSALHALSRAHHDVTKASRPFCKQRDGFVMGEGAAVFILESEEHALKRGAHIYAEFSGGAINSDAYHMTSPLEDGRGVAKCIELALKNASLLPEDIDYINAHATSTPAGDLCELKAIAKIFDKNSVLPKINSTKSMIGHALGACGGLELAAVLMAMKTKRLHATMNISEREEEAKEFDLLENGPIDHKVQHAISNSFGFGGHNSVIVVSAYNKGEKEND